MNFVVICLENLFHVYLNKLSIDVDEESEYDIFYDHVYGPRSSKSRSPDSMKYLNNYRKSSSGYYSFSLVLAVIY